MKLSSILFRTIRHHNEQFLDRGLYGGAKIRFGNHISEFKNKSRRKFELNLKWTSLHSNVLSRPIRVRLTCRVLKEIDRVGGIDNYVHGQRQLEGLKAEALKKVMILRQWRQELQDKEIVLGYNLRNTGMRV